MIKVITHDNQRIQFLVSEAIVLSSEWVSQHSPQKMCLETRKEVLKEDNECHVPDSKLA
jgi:hypothetical protein